MSRTNLIVPDRETVFAYLDKEVKTTSSTETLKELLKFKFRIEEAQAAEWVDAWERRGRRGNSKNNEKDWPRVYQCSWLEQGLVSYQDVGAGVALLKKETIERCMQSLVGKPVIIDHQDVTPRDFKQEAVGYVTRVWFNAVDGWFWCEFLLIDDNAKRKAAEGYSVSCSFDVNGTGEGGEWHAIPFDEELTEINFTHLAMVSTPRYEACQIYANSKSSQVISLRENQTTDKTRPEDKKKEEAEAKEKPTALDRMSPLQLDKYLSSLSDPGLQLLNEGEYGELVKKAVELHQEERMKKQEEALMKSAVEGKEANEGEEQKKPAANSVSFKFEDKTPQEVVMFGKKKAAEVAQRWDAKEAFVTVDNGQEMSVEELIKFYNESKKTEANAKKNEEKPEEEKKEAAKNEEKAEQKPEEKAEEKKEAVKNESEEKKEEVKKEDKKDACNDAKKNDAVGGDGDGDADDIGDARGEVKETERAAAKKKDEKAEEKEEKEEELSIKRNQGKETHFMRLNDLHDAASEVTDLAIDLLSNKIERGKSRYGSTK